MSSDPFLMIVGLGKPAHQETVVQPFTSIRNHVVVRMWPNIPRATVPRLSPLWVGLHPERIVYYEKFFRETFNMSHIGKIEMAALGPQLIVTMDADKYPADFPDDKRLFTVFEFIENEEDPVLSDMGTYYGYPHCCVKAFKERKEQKLGWQAVKGNTTPFAGTRYVPCDECCLKQKDVLEAYISAHRKAINPFPKDDWPTDEFDRYIAVYKGEYSVLPVDYTEWNDALNAFVKPTKSMTEHLKEIVEKSGEG